MKLCNVPTTINKLFQFRLPHRVLPFFSSRRAFPFPQSHFLVFSPKLIIVFFTESNQNVSFHYVYTVPLAILILTVRLAQNKTIHAVAYILTDFVCPFECSSLNTHTLIIRFDVSNPFPLFPPVHLIVGLNIVDYTYTIYKISFREKP